MYREDGLCIEWMVHVWRGWSMYGQDCPYIEKKVYVLREWSMSKDDYSSFLNLSFTQLYTPRGSKHCAYSGGHTL